MVECEECGDRCTTSDAGVSWLDCPVDAGKRDLLTAGQTHNLVSSPAWEGFGPGLAYEVKKAAHSYIRGMT